MLKVNMACQQPKAFHVIHLKDHLYIQIFIKSVWTREAGSIALGWTHFQNWQQMERALKKCRLLQSLGITHGKHMIIQQQNCYQFHLRSLQKISLMMWPTAGQNKVRKKCKACNCIHAYTHALEVTKEGLTYRENTLQSFPVRAKMSEGQHRKYDR